MKKRTSTFPKPQRGAGGNAIWTVKGHSYYWNGPGSRLRLMFGDQLIAIDHHHADGSYTTISEAEAALRRLVGAQSGRRRRK